MKSQIFKLLLIVAISGITACHQTSFNDDWIASLPAREVTFIASSIVDENHSMTKATVGEDWSVRWDVNEELGGWSSDTPANTFAVFAASNDVKTNIAEFKGNIAGDRIRLVYPFDSTPNIITTSNKYPISIENQSADMHNERMHLKETMYMVSPELTIQNNTIPDFSMEYISAILKLKLNFIGEITNDEIIYKVEISSLPISATINLSADDINNCITDIVGGKLNITINNPPKVEENVITPVLASIIPFEMPADSEFTIKVYYRKGEHGYLIEKKIPTNNKINFERGKYHSINVECNTQTATHIGIVDTWSGEGTIDRPFLIANKNDLEALSNSVNNGKNYSGKYFSLTQDIDLQCSSSNQWNAIGTSENPFSGVFDGNRFRIDNIYISNNEYCQGLFGRITSGSIKDVSVSGFVSGQHMIGGIVGWIDENSSIFNCANFTSVRSYDNIVGGVAGSSRGKIVNCINMGDVIGGPWSTGGIVGSLESGIIANCCNTATINGRLGDIGGIAGSSRGSIINCYNTGAINNVGEKIGAIVGECQLSGSIENCYYLSNSEAKGLGHSITSEEMRSLEFAQKLNDGASIYNIGETNMKAREWITVHGDYPVLDLDTEVNELNLSTIFKGSGTQDNPYLINNKRDIQQLSYITNMGGSKANTYFNLTSNINLGGINDLGESVEENEWATIGTKSNPFRGEFDGLGYIISGIYINKPNQNYQGLFGYVTTNELQNIKVVESYILASNAKLGGVVGYIEGDITNCSFSGSIVGIGSYVGSTGGVAGGVIGVVADCYNTATVNSQGGSVGGVVGSASKVVNCYNTGNINASWDNSGGICGSSSTVINCYNTGNIKGRNSVGGISCWLSGDSYIVNCYNTGSVSCIGSDAGGITSSSYGDIRNCFNTGKISGKDSFGAICSGRGYMYIYDCYYSNDYGDSDHGISMGLSEMQNSDFTETLNRNANFYNVNYPSNDVACAWKNILYSTPTLDFNKKPTIQ